MSLTSYRAAPPRDPVQPHNASAFPRRKKFPELNFDYNRVAVLHPTHITIMLLLVTRLVYGGLPAGA
jgi:hypothetical protein